MVLPFPKQTFLADLILAMRQITDLSMAIGCADNQIIFKFYMHKLSANFLIINICSTDDKCILGIKPRIVGRCHDGLDLFNRHAKA